MVFEAFRLTTFTQAALAGYSTEYPAGEAGDEWVFLTPGPNGDKLRTSHSEWTDLLRTKGATHARLDHIPVDPALTGILVTGDSEIHLYTLSSRITEEDGHQRYWCKGHPVPASFQPEPIDQTVASQRLQASIAELTDFAQANRKNAFLWVPQLQQAAQDLDALLMGNLTHPAIEPIANWLPPIYPRQNQLLFSAAWHADIIRTGGMDSWYDGGDFNDPEFLRITKEFQESHFAGLRAASALT